MKTAAIYCRVSSEGQEREGTSLKTQLEACLNYCQGKSYDASYRYSEAYSGLTLERPKLDELRDLVRKEQIDVLVVYSLDRLSRNPNHGVIILNDLEKHQVTLEAVTETVDSSRVGRLMTYIRQWAAEQEVEDLKDRARRGKRARAKEGRMSGGFHITYGYDYIPVSQENGGRRAVNNTEASWVKRIFQWLVNEGLSTSAITHRLRALNAPTKLGNIWNRRSVQGILKNPAYTGKTYAFSRRFTRPQTDWIEIPDVTPVIINQELFDAAQKQLRLNRQRTVPNTKYEYLLRGRIRCRQCGRAYVGSYSHQRYYRCTGKLKLTAPVERCGNKSWSADKLEGVVWAELKRYLSNPSLIARELDRRRQEVDQLGVLEPELQEIGRQQKAINREQHQLLQWALKGFPADQVEAENKRLNKARETLKVHKAELEVQIKASQDAAINIPKLEGFIERIQGQIASLDFQGKLLALDMLGITVYLNGQDVEVTGVIEPEKQVSRCTHTSGCATGCVHHRR